jgi:DNA polymerase III delta subunit
MTGSDRTASNHREISVTQGLTSLRGKSPAAVYVFAPGDDYFKPQARDAARSLVPENMRAFDYAEYDGVEESVDDIVEFLGSPSFGQSRKVLVLDGLDEKTAKRLSAHASLFLSGPLTVIFSDPARVPDGLLDNACVIANYVVPPADVRSWVRKRVGKRLIEDQAVHELLERTAGNFYLMRSEIDKLLAYTDQQITIRDVREVVAKTHTVAAADLVEAISLGRIDRASAALADLAAAGVSDTTVLYDVEMGFMRLLNAKLVSRSNRPKADLKAWCQRTQHQYLDDRSVAAVLAAAARVKLRDIELLLDRLEDIEYRTKKGLISNALTALEQLLSEVALTIQSA